MEKWEFAVVGTGLFGSAAVRHLAEHSDRVIAIGQSEPVDRRTHDGVFSSHYDEGRLTRRTSANRLWAEMTAQTFDAVEELEALTGDSIGLPVGSLTVQPAEIEGRHGRALYEDLTHGPIDARTWAVGDDGWRSEFEMYDFPRSCEVRYEGPPAGIVKPRALAAAQLGAAADLGATLIDDMVVEVTERSGGVDIRLRGGAVVTAEQVVVATGSFTNLLPLTPVVVPTTVETETLVLATVPDGDGEKLTSAPVVTYTIDDPFISDIYMTPPLMYPDGRWKVKVGANTVDDSFPTSRSEVQRWFNLGPWVGPHADEIEHSFVAALRSIWRDVDFVAVEGEPCIITMTNTDHPVIERVSDRTCVAVAGNGTGAKSSDGWGRLAAELSMGVAWPEWVDAAVLSIAANTTR